MTDHEDEVGSVAEEAAKLFGAFADMARQHGVDAAGGVGGLAGQAAAFTQDLHDHLATDDPECRYCPVCRAVHVVRKASPEVRDHLMSAASSLLQAAAGLLETVPSAGDPGDSAPRGAWRRSTWTAHLPGPGTRTPPDPVAPERTRTRPGD
ncbi:hypothetical protein [Nocardioides sambongensis]|uniref:hypothetical protein n=1 Tax=Nocardioides sambongensis TaxID=2589074 RepID=UPI0011269B4A|nr:hypothetical protein [Nocardioides sambongensis]